MNSSPIKNSVRGLREQGTTYTEIQACLNIKLSKSTISYWCKDVKLPLDYKINIIKQNKFNIEKARNVALVVNKEKREKYLTSLSQRNEYLGAISLNHNVGKIILAMLYFGEGGKNRKGAMQIGNSNPEFIRTFLFYFRHCYKTEVSKFRVTIQCRADQDARNLENYWKNITNIPSEQFYKTRIDPRSIGKPTLKENYKGVCRIEYFSADIYNELKAIINIICKISNKGL